MIAAGIDVGAKTTKAVIVDDERIVGLSSLVQTGFDQLASARKAFLEALKHAGKEESSVGRVFSTGAGAKAVTFATTSISDMRALARGVAHRLPTARTVIDVGAEEGRAVRLDENGRPLDFAVNEKCAAGTGAFVEAMSRALDVPL